MENSVTSEVAVCRCSTDSVLLKLSQCPTGVCHTFFLDLLLTKNFISCVSIFFLLLLFFCLVLFFGQLRLVSYFNYLFQLQRLFSVYTIMILLLQK